MSRLIAILLAVSGVGLTAAQQTAPVIQFEVASVKVNASGDTESMWTFPPSGQIHMTNVTVREIIIQAFQLNRQLARFALVGLPERFVRTRFDITAKPPDDAPTGQTPAMLRGLLTERFGLRTHTEKRATPVYALKVASAGGFGSNFRASQHNCDEWVKAAPQGNVVEPADANGKSWCRSNPFDRDGISARGAGTIAQLIRSVQAFVDRPIADMTGLSGNFEWEVKFVSTSLGRASGPNVPEVFTAFREQLGLTLEAQTAPQEVLVIDQVQMPTPD
ncbi:MAG: TIGR03435 family protein [Vicinamibacterales bacterium]